MLVMAIINVHAQEPEFIYIQKNGKEAINHEVEEEPIPFQLVEEKPSFQGGDANQFSKWVSQNLVYPEIARLFVEILSV